MFDVIIIGAGPAGISASLYTTRENLKTLILYNEESSIEKSTLIENYYGFENGINGEKLYNAGIMQAKRLGADVRKQEVVKIEQVENYFNITTEKDIYKSKTVVLATGNKKSIPEIHGLKELEGKGISYCAICDGFFYKNKKVAVLGNGNYAISEINDLLNITKKVVMLTNGKKAPEFRDENVEIITKPIKEVMGKERLEKVQFNDNSCISVDGLFVAQGVAGSQEFAKKIGLIEKDKKIIINEKMETNIKGIYACGDCTPGTMQVAKAVYEGMIAGLEIAKKVQNNR